MTLLEEVIELDTMLANDGYKSCGYARLTLDKVIKALTAPPDVNPLVMQAEGSDVICTCMAFHRSDECYKLGCKVERHRAAGAAVGQRSVDTVAERGTCPYANHDLHLKLFGYCNACETRIERSSHEAQP